MLGMRIFMPSLIPTDAFGLVLSTAILLLVAGRWLYIFVARSQSELMVTDKRILGHCGAFFFKKRVELQINKLMTVQVKKPPLQLSSGIGVVTIDGPGVEAVRIKNLVDADKFADSVASAVAASPERGIGA